MITGIRYGKVEYQASEVKYDVHQSWSIIPADPEGEEVLRVLVKEVHIILFRSEGRMYSIQASKVDREIEEGIPWLIVKAEYDTFGNEVKI